MEKWVVHLKSFLIFCLLGFQTFGHSQQIVVNTMEGESYFIEIDPIESLGSILDKVGYLSENALASKHLLIEIPLQEEARFCCMKPSRNQGQLLDTPREYRRPVSEHEISDIRLIVLSLANRSLFTLALPSVMKELEDAGDRIDPVHPLNFLRVVFSDEEMKVAIRNIRKRGIVWGPFINGLKDSLTTESQIGNMRDEYIADFAQVMGVQYGSVYPLISQKRWDDLVNFLILKIPRGGDYGRYDD